MCRLQRPVLLPLPVFECYLPILPPTPPTPLPSLCIPGSFSIVTLTLRCSVAELNLHRKRHDGSPPAQRSQPERHFRSRSRPRRRQGGPPRRPPEAEGRGQRGDRHDRRPPRPDARHGPLPHGPGELDPERALRLLETRRKPHEFVSFRLLERKEPRDPCGWCGEFWPRLYFEEICNI